MLFVDRYIFKITSDQSLFRPTFGTRDKLGTQMIASFYTPDPPNDAKDVTIGHTMCMSGARARQFLDGQVGFRIEDPSTVEVRLISQYLTSAIDLISDATRFAKEALGNQHCTERTK